MGSTHVLKNIMGESRRVHCHRPTAWAPLATVGPVFSSPSPDQLLFVFFFAFFLVGDYPGDGGFCRPIDAGMHAGSGGFSRSTVAALASGKGRLLRLFLRRLWCDGARRLT
ncbi:hypothetical protein Rs2_13520 [Raphanus sativus]|nr:hypothetical protein Rs2_13520 [Raphanus sativus]